jgi:hypothetical protein
VRQNTGVLDAANEYRIRRDARLATRDALNRLDARYAYSRLATFAAGVLLALLSWRTGLTPWSLLLPVIAFGWLVKRHDGVLRQRAEATSAASLYERGLARLDDRWSGTGETGERFRDDRHLFANDLDLFGRGSLFELLSLARTRTGEETLARWLTSPADAAEIRARQQAVSELREALDLRERLAVAGADVRASVHTDRLLEWAARPMPATAGLRVGTWVFTAATAAGILSLVLTGTYWPLVVILLLQSAVFRSLRNTINSIVSGREPEEVASFVADALTHRAIDLDVLAGLLTILERQEFTCQRLQMLRGRLVVDGAPASRAVRRLHRLATLHDSGKNAVIFPLGLFLFRYVGLALISGALIQLVGPHVAVAVASWRRSYASHIREWLQTVAELEALMSLASYHYERPADPFPEIIGADGASRPRAVFDGQQLGHPLLAAAGMVRNDVHLSGGTQLLVISGSNMSGKSTLLRTVGVNVVLALAGAPVRAASLRLSPLAIGATLRIQDSLLEGKSRFYAEITRLREIADVADGPVPLLFLLDELLQGTNSHDRVIGAAGVLLSLLDRGAIGLTTTHDLAVTAVADRLAPRAVNVHFEDWFEGEQLQFDYVMKPGPVTRSNALALMRAVGLSIDSQ